MSDLLSRLNISNFDVATYMNKNADNISYLPNIAIAASGGGYRAMLNGAGAVAAFDSRTENSTGPGQLGGLLQSATYFSGLSGGSWLVGSIYINNFTSIQAILGDSTSGLWNLEDSILQGPATVSNYYRQLIDTVSGKTNAGFNDSITDYWGRALSYQFINATDGGPAYTWSSIALQPEFIDGKMPMPIVIADERAPGQLAIAPNTTIFEFNPWEVGTFDPTTYGFVPLKYLGSNFSAGTLPQDEECVRGFDNAGFMMGTSSSLFNQAFLLINGTSEANILTNALTAILEEIGNDNNDISLYGPNPFYFYRNETNANAQSPTLFLVDGGEDLQNVPFHPLIQPARSVDVIFAIDSSADTQTFWPNGTSMVATYRRSLNLTGIANGTVFPSVPDQNTFVNLGLNARPTFFGCDSSNMTGPSPLIVYIPNFPYSYQSNVSTFDLQFNDTERNAIIQNGYNVVTMANGTIDMDWPACVGCSILSRSLERTGTDVPVVCQHCFTRYCWNGTINSTSPLLYSPEAVLTANAESGATKLFARLTTLTFLSAFMIGLSAIF
ncbi:lysophospholipase [Exophiala aquamarina CBS 119918]|uniref:Lysophospholipase n=1 Tax=Exophiala aquamarina CBS 119918 TaxID=1182545 RepID=A0A072PNZ7_9EURO|nr:lysophospholipase [Exophiala aquamarina CBS 119918]KEF57225.1 lysophospholipase [Exophiala aquamarina CBS 119918]